MNHTFILLHPASRSCSCKADCSARAGDFVAAAAAAALVAARAGIAAAAGLLLGLLRLFFPMVQSTKLVKRALVAQGVCRSGAAYTSCCTLVGDLPVAGVGVRVCVYLLLGTARLRITAEGADLPDHFLLLQANRSAVTGQQRGWQGVVLQQSGLAVRWRQAPRSCLKKHPDFDPQGPPSPNTFSYRDAPYPVNLLRPCCVTCLLPAVTHDNGAAPGERRESFETPGSYARTPREPSQHGRPAPASSGRCNRRRS